METTAIIQFPAFPNPRRKLQPLAQATAPSHLGYTNNLPLRPNESRRLADAPLPSRTSTPGTCVSEETPQDTTGSCAVDISSREAPTCPCPDPTGCARCSKSQYAHIGCRHPTPSPPLLGSTNNTGVISAAIATTTSRCTSNCSFVPPAPNESLPTLPATTRIAAICSHNHACVTASSSSSSTTTAFSPLHSNTSASTPTTPAEHAHEFGHEYPGVFGNHLTIHDNNPRVGPKGNRGKDKGPKMGGGLRRIREAFSLRRNTSLGSRTPSTATAATAVATASDDESYPSDHQNEGRSRVVSGTGKSDDSVVATDSPQRRFAALPPAPLPPMSEPRPSRQRQLPMPSLAVSTSSPRRPLSSPDRHNNASASPEALASMSFHSSIVSPSGQTPPANPRPRTSDPVFHRHNIFKRPSSPLRPSTSTSSSPHTNINTNTQQGKIKKCGKKTKPPPLRTTYTYAFAPAALPEAENDSHSESGGISDVEGNRRGRATVGGGDVGDAPRRRSSLNPNAGSSRLRPRTASGDDHLHYSHQQPRNGVKQATMVPEMVVPIFVPLAPRVAGSLPIGVSVVNSSISSSLVLPVPACAPPSWGQNGRSVQGGSGAATRAATYASSSASAAATAPVTSNMMGAGLEVTGIDEFGQKVYRRSLPPAGAAVVIARSVPRHMAGEVVASSNAMSNDLELERLKDKKAHLRFSLR